VWVYALKARFDAASLLSELDRVGEQVPDHLLQSGGAVIAADLAQIEADAATHPDQHAARRILFAVIVSGRSHRRKLARRRLRSYTQSPAY